MCSTNPIIVGRGRDIDWKGGGKGRGGQRENENRATPKQFINSKKRLFDTGEDGYRELGTGQKKTHDSKRTALLGKRTETLEGEGGRIQGKRGIRLDPGGGGFHP